MLTAITATLPGSLAGAQSSRAGSNMLICQHPLLNNPIQMARPWGMITTPSPNKPSTAIQISAVDSIRLQVASIYRPTWL